MVENPVAGVGENQGQHKGILKMSNLDGYVEQATRDIIAGMTAERCELARKLGWTPPPEDDEWWFKADYGPVSVCDLWPLLMREIDELLINARD